MWSTNSAFHHHPVWGLHQRELAQESADFQAGLSMAACISTLDLLRVSGADAETFLQGQTTCDFKEVSAGQCRLGAHCTAKGRIQATFRALRWGDDFLLLLPAGQGEPTRAALAKFALFSKVTLTLDTDLAALGLLGPAASGWSADLTGAAPAAGNVQLSAAGLVVCLDTQRFLVLLPQSDTEAMLASLQARAIPCAGDNIWWLAEVSAGIAHILPQLSEQWIPQEINYDLVNGVNFKKGCYKGQEIVARIHYRGQTKVRVQRVLIEGEATVEPGTHIRSNTDQNAGTLLQVVYVNERTLMGLAALKMAASESETLQLEPKDGSQVRLLPMPYAINN